MTVHFQRFRRCAWDVSWRMFAALILLIGCLSFPAGEELPVPELDWGSASTLSAAEQAYSERRYQDAIRLYTEAAKSLSEQSAALLGRGMAHEMVNQTQKAIEDYKRAIDVDRKNYRAMENLAGIYERGGRYISEAITLYQHALKLDPRPEWKENLAAWIAMLETRLQPQTSSAVGCWHLANRKAKAGARARGRSLVHESYQTQPGHVSGLFQQRAAPPQLWATRVGLSRTSRPRSAYHLLSEVASFKRVLLMNKWATGRRPGRIWNKLQKLTHVILKLSIIWHVCWKMPTNLHVQHSCTRERLVSGPGPSCGNL